MQKQQVELAIIGDAGVGKTSLIHAFKGEKDNYQTTQILDFKQVQFRNCEMNIYDMAGDPKFHYLIKDLILKASSVIIAFDLSESEPLQRLDYFYQLVQEKHIIFVGCKCDIQIKNDADLIEDIKQITKLENINYFKTSVKDNINIQELLEEWYTLTQIYFKKKDIFAYDDDNEINKPYCYCCNIY